MSGQVSATGSSNFGRFLDWLGHSPRHVGVAGWQVSDNSVGESSGVVCAVELDGSGHNFGCILDGSFASSSGVSSHVSSPSCCYFGRFLCWWLERRVGVVQEGIVVPTGGKLGRNNTGQRKENGNYLNGEKWTIIGFN
jgi:hypothetical protein